MTVKSKLRKGEIATVDDEMQILVIIGVPD